MKTIVFVSAGVVWCACAAKKGEESEPKALVTVQVALVSRADVPIKVQAPAVLHPREQANITARTPAVIQQIKVKKGDDVKAGQLLVVLENRDIQAQREEAEAAVTDAQAGLSKMSNGTFHVEIERAKGQLQAAQAGYNQAQKTFEKRQDLFKQGAIPQRELLLTQTERETMRANLEVARKNVELLQGEKDVRMAESKVKQADARLHLQNAQLNFTQIRSPFTGTVTEQFVYPGDMASPTVPMLTVMDLSIVVARTQIPEAEVRLVRPGQACSFIPSDAPDAAVQGHITVLNKAVDLQRRTVEGWCEISNKEGQLRAGAFGSVVVISGVDKNSLVVPVSAVQFKEGTREGSTLVVDDKHVAHTREVQVGVTVDGKVQIKGGLKEGEQVVSEGGYNTPDGTSITIGEKAKPQGKDEKKEPASK